MGRPTALILSPRVSGIPSAVAWLRDHNVSTQRIAGIFGITDTYARQLAFRGQWRIRRPNVPVSLEAPFDPPANPFEIVNDRLRRIIGIRPGTESWTVKLNPAGRRHLDELEESIEQLGADFWSGVRHGTGISRFREILIRIGRPAHFRRIRLHARVRHLLAETYAHAGYSTSAITQALTALLLSRAAFDESRDCHDLEEFARTALVISQSHLLRLEPERAAHYLDLHRDAKARTGQPLGGEYLRQRGVLAFQSGPAADEEARRNFQSAMESLSETVEYGRHKERYEVLNIGPRQLNLVGKVNWEGAQGLLDYMLKALTPEEIHISMNVNWTAACGLTIENGQANLRAMELLGCYREASAGFGHQATVAWLLSLALDIPREIRSTWIRRALYENTFKDR